MISRTRRIASGFVSLALVAVAALAAPVEDESDGLCCVSTPPNVTATPGELTGKVSTGDLLTFEGLGDQEAVLNFYNGGFGGNGSGPGPSLGVTFLSNALAIIDADAGGSGNFGGEPSPSTVLFFLSGSAVMNVSGGFTTGFSFYYSAIHVPGSVRVYDGPNATGHVLATITLPLTPDSGAPDPSGPFSPLVPIGVSFAGTARSVDFGGTANQIAFDNITFGSQVPTPGDGVGCVATSTALCLNNSRFRVTAQFDAGGGNTGAAQVVKLTPDTGYLWFFVNSNVELVVKVLDACGVNGKFWVFAGGLTDVRVDMQVTDTATGHVRSYVNPRGTRFQPIQDTAAFACSSGAAQPYGVDAHTVALWHFEDPPGTTVADATGTNDGTAAASSTVVTSLFGHGRRFRGDAAGDFVTVDDHPSLRGMSQLTLEAWIYPTNFVLPTFNGAETIVGRGDATPPYDIYQITLARNGDSPSFNYFTVAMEILAGGRDSQAASAVHHGPNQWYYVVGTYDGQRARIYVNGVLEQTGNLSAGIVVNTTDPLFIDMHTFFNQFDASFGMIGGIFDEVRISNVARSPSEIAAIYEAAVH